MNLKQKKFYAIKELYQTININQKSICVFVHISNLNTIENNGLTLKFFHFVNYRSQYLDNSLHILSSFTPLFKQANQLSDDMLTYMLLKSNSANNHKFSKHFFAIRLLSLFTLLDTMQYISLPIAQIQFGLFICAGIFSHFLKNIPNYTKLSYVMNLGLMLCLKILGLIYFTITCGLSLQEGFMLSFGIFIVPSSGHNLNINI